MIKKLTKLTKTLLVAAGLCVGVNVWGTPTIIKTYDFDSATDAVSSQTVLPYNGTTKIDKTDCDILTGDWSGIAVQGAGGWHIYHENSNGGKAGNGYYNNNGGGRKFALLNLQAGDIVHITASGALPTGATNGTYDSEKSTAGSDCYYTVTANGNFAITTTARYHYIHVVTVTRDLADLETPTYEITGVNGNERQVTLSCLTDGAAIKYNTTDDKDAPGWTTYSAPFYTAETTLYAYSEKSASTSDVVEITTGAGSAITLNAPAISGSFEKKGLAYNPKYSFSSNQSGKVIGEPTLTYTYSFNSGATVEGTSYSPSENGSLTVTVSAEGYTSNSTTQAVFGGDFVRTYFFDAIDDVTVDTGSGTWGNQTNVNSTQWTFTGIGNCEYTLRDDISLSGFMYARATTAETKQGFYSRTSSGSISFKLSEGEAIMFTTRGDNIIANSSVTSQGIAQYTNIRSINIFTPPTEVQRAIIECEKYETSQEFATAVEAGSFSTAAEVYAFHSAWQVAKANASGSVDYSKAIMNRTFELHNTNGWTIYGDANTTAGNIKDREGAVEYGDDWSQYYTGYNGRNVSQIIAGLPAGKYTLTAKVYSWINNGAPVRLFANGQLSSAEDGLEHNPSLTFTVTGNETNIKIGIGGTGKDNDTDNTWGTWGYRVKNFTLTKTHSDVTITSAGWATLYTPYALDFSGVTGLEAYTATCDGSTVTLTKVTDVPANTGVVLKGVENTYNIPVIASSETAKGDLKGSTTEAIDYADGKNYYYLALNKSGEAQFIPLKSGSIAAGKAYLEIETPSPASPARQLTVKFADDVTGISSIENDQISESDYYNLSGQRVAAPSKGLYIKNGKKVIMK